MLHYEHMGMKKTAMEWLNYWIAERELIRKRKEEQEIGGIVFPPLEKPWSKDPIFQTTYFCNVRREDDKVTRWIRQNWTPHWFGEMYDYSIVLARMLNNIPCLEGILTYVHEDFELNDFKELHKYLDHRAFNENQVWGGAYVVTSHGLRMPKAAYLCQRVLPAAHKALVGASTAWGHYMGSAPTLARSHELLMQLEGLGSFMAAQVIADLKNTEGHPLQKAEDWSWWSAPGPGSLRGIKWVFPESKPTEYSARMMQIRTLLTTENYQLLSFPADVPNMQDLQNCLCEFDKFMRVMTKTGKSKRKYDGK